MEERGKHLGKSGGKAASQSDDTFSGPGYRPKTKETKAAYEKLLTSIQVCLGDVSQDILRAGAEECLAILKGDEYLNTQRIEIKKFLGNMSDATYQNICSCADRINDFSPDVFSETPEQNEKTASSSAGATQDDIGVAVVFDDDDESGSDAFEIPSSSDEDSDIDSQQNLLTEGIVGAASSKNSNSLESVHAPSIDAYWLQRKFSEYFDDPTASSEKADEALEILQTPDERACENRLLLLLGVERFDGQILNAQS